MHKDVAQFIKKCESCQKLKNPVGHLRVHAPYLARPNTLKPWDIVSTDVMQLHESFAGTSECSLLLTPFLDTLKHCLLQQ